MEERLDYVIKSLSCIGAMLSVMMLAVDFFKRYDDTYGHSMGDECLKIIAKALNDSITSEDNFVARYGGEEFVVVLPDTDEREACIIADKILEKVRACNILHEKNEVAGYIRFRLE